MRARTCCTCWTSATRCTRSSQRSGRLEWAREECRRLEDSTDERDPELAYERLPRASSLDPRSRTVARELAAWRERTASAEDKPVGSILPDAALVEIAKRKPSHPDELEQIRGLHGGHLRRRGPELVAAVERGPAADPIAARGARSGFGAGRRAADRARRGGDPRAGARAPASHTS